MNWLQKNNRNIWCHTLNKKRINCCSYNRNKILVILAVVMFLLLLHHHQPLSCSASQAMSTHYYSFPPVRLIKIFCQTALLESNRVHFPKIWLDSTHKLARNMLVFILHNLSLPKPHIFLRLLLASYRSRSSKPKLIDLPNSI